MTQFSDLQTMRDLAAELGSYYMMGATDALEGNVERSEFPSRDHEQAYRLGHSHQIAAQRAEHERVG